MHIDGRTDTKQSLTEIESLKEILLPKCKREVSEIKEKITIN
jgi:hypothetical protein